MLDGLAADQRPEDGQQLARLLVKAKKLTAYQAQEIYVGRGASLVLGNYVVLDKLGHGGMGLVLKAEHRRMQHLVPRRFFPGRDQKRRNDCEFRAGSERNGQVSD